MLFSLLLSEGDATSWLALSEIVLVAGAVVLTIGLIGEWPESEG